MNRLRDEISEEEKQSVLDAFSNYTFFHKFEIFKDVYTPGSFNIDPIDILDRNNIGHSLYDVKTLDIGCMEGTLAYEFEKRGAIAHALDIHNPDEVAFNLCKQLLSSEVKHYRDTVYNLPNLFKENTFDIIAFRGVYYHLKDPIGALEAISKVLRPDGKMLISGECLINEMFDLDGNKFDAGPITQTVLNNIPITICYPGKIKGVPSSIWYVPNLACIKSWLIATGFELKQHNLSVYSNAKISVHGTDRSLQRFEGVAKRVDRQPIVEYPTWK